MKKFKKKNSFALSRMTNEERANYYKEAKEYYSNLKNQLKNFRKLDGMHKLILFGIRFFPVETIIINDLKLKDEKPVIFSANHSNSNDFLILGRAIKRHFFVVADYTMINDFKVNLINKLNGCIYVDRKSKESGKNAFDQAVDGVQKGYDMLIFPESTWNLLESVPILPRMWGDIKIAMATGRPIVPVAVEYNNNKAYINFGFPVYINKDSNLVDMDDYLRGEMTRLKYEIWENDIYKKNYVKPDYDKWLSDTINSYSGFDVEYEMSMIRKTDDYYKEDFEHILEVGKQIESKKRKRKYPKVDYKKQ